jgi:hypothetical protein
LSGPICHLVEQSALADARLDGDEGNAGVALLSALELVPQRTELGQTAGQPSRLPIGDDVGHNQKRLSAEPQ